MAKQAFDWIAASVMLVLLLPLLAIVALLVRIRLGSPIFFRQRRPGLHGKPFHLIKFRSMTDQRDSKGDLCSDEIRLTGFGRFLRASSLDELPEVINVLRGEMSLVGPRPLLMEYLDRYTERQARRHEVRPGITGWAQVNGRNAVSWEERFELDVWYVENQSLWLDVRILLATLVTVFSRAGVSAEGHATMPEFGSQHAESRESVDG